MTTTDLTPTSAGGTTDLAMQMEFARAVAGGDARGSILPESYRGNPANVLIAVGLGQAMGLSPAESLYRISVIKGKPSAGAELIASNVRKAGHKLRVRGDETTCTATIVRADDPEFEFTVTRDLAWAKAMGLASNDNYKKQPGTMLQWRAITAVARLACPEALYGVTYTPDEAAEIRDGDTAPRRQSAASVLDIPQKEPTSEREPDPEPVKPSKAQLDKMFAMLRAVGCADRASALAYVNDVLAYEGEDEITSRAQLDASEVSQVIDAVDAELQKQAAAQDDDVHQGDLLDDTEAGEPKQ